MDKCKDNFEIRVSGIRTAVSNRFSGIKSGDTYINTLTGFLTAVNRSHKTYIKWLKEDTINTLLTKEGIQKFLNETDEIKRRKPNQVIISIDDIAPITEDEDRLNKLREQELIYEDLNFIGKDNDLYNIDYEYNGQTYKGLTNLLKAMDVSIFEFKYYVLNKRDKKDIRLCLDKLKYTSDTLRLKLRVNKYYGSKIKYQEYEYNGLKFNSKTLLFWYLGYSKNHFDMWKGTHKEQVTNNFMEDVESFLKYRKKADEKSVKKELKLLNSNM